MAANEDSRAVGEGGPHGPSTSAGYGGQGKDAAMRQEKLFSVKFVPFARPELVVGW